MTVPAVLETHSRGPRPRPVPGSRSRALDSVWEPVLGTRMARPLCAPCAFASGRRNRKWDVDMPAARPGLPGASLVRPQRSFLRPGHNHKAPPGKAAVKDGRHTPAASGSAASRPLLEGRLPRRQDRVARARRTPARNTRHRQTWMPNHQTARSCLTWLGRSPPRLAAWFGLSRLRTLSSAVHSCGDCKQLLPY